MTLWKLTLSYDGTAFHGWQVQPGRPTVQGCLSDALFHLTGERVLPQGSGRTDTGVHALAQVASFELSAPLPPDNLRRALNRSLPSSIRVLAAEPAPPGFHARHSALKKTYEYRIFERRPAGCSAERICSPFLAPFVWPCRWQLDLPAMQQAARLLLGTHDFTSFATTDPDMSQRGGDLRERTDLSRSLFVSEVTREADLLLYRVTGSGFLHHMVRNVVGTLAEVGRGALSPAHIPIILARRDRAAAGPTAPPQGLFLVSVDYAAASSEAAALRQAAHA